MPLVIVTDAARSPSGNETPRNESVWSPAVAGTPKLPRLWPAASKYSIRVEPEMSTSVKTAPKPFTVAGVVVPDWKKFTVVWVLLRAVNSRSVVNVSKIVG